MSNVTRKGLRLHKGRAGGEVEVFAMLPDEVLRSEAYRTLPHPARSLLTVISAQYRGNNNGSLTFTRDTARDYGITNPYALIESFAELQARGLILVTRHGTTVPPRSAMFAVPWRKIDPPNPQDPHDANATVTAPDTWRKWKAEQRGMHWTVERRDRTDRPFKKQANADHSAVWAVDTRIGRPGIQAKPEIGRPGIPKTPEISVGRGYLSDILGLGGTGNGKVSGGEDDGLVKIAPAGKAQGGGQAQEVPAPAVPQPVAARLSADVEELLARARRNQEQRKVKFGRRASATTTTTALPDIERPALEFMAADPRYQERLKGIRERAAKYPRWPGLRSGKSHLKDPFWPEAVLLLAEGKGGDEKSIASFLGRLVSKYGWDRVKILVQEAEVLMLWGVGATSYVEFSILIPPTTQMRDDVARISVH